VTATPLSAARAATAWPARASTAIAALPLLAITATGAALRLWAFAGVAPNPFYDAAVRSMATSWHAFFFGAFDPGGQTSIDKPPADLWLQVASVKLLGFSSVATRLPEALAGIVAIPLLYDLVRRLFGRPTGLAAAAALAVLPAAVLTARSDTMDSLMMLLDVLAAWLVVLGAQRGRAWPVVAAGAVLGLAFEVKLFQALVAVPAIALLAVVALPRRRVLALTGGLAALLAVGASWIAAASATPLGARPWPIGSTNGSIWNSVFVFDGLDRLTGHASAAALAQDPPGLTRLFARGYATSVGTLLLAALVLGGAAAAWALAGRRFARLPLAGALCLGVWLLPGVALLSHMQRMQPRYLETVTPAVAGVAGAGLAALVRAAHARLGTALYVTAVATAGLGGLLLARPPAWAVATALAGVAGCALAAALRARAGALLTLGLVAILAAPAAAAVDVARSTRSDAGAPLSISPPELARLSGFLVAHQAGARYEAASTSAFRAAPLIIHDARPVLSLTSVYGRPLLSAAAFREAVATGQVRYILGRESCHASSSCAPVVAWASAHSHDVSRTAGLAPGTLYRLR
jgi:4-amino-4-deoxy-L-arabinose transferase-like glycosyltransferase